MVIDKFCDQNALAMVLEKTLATGLNFLVVAVLARKLGPEIFGTFGLVQAIFLIGFHVALFFNEQTIIKFAQLEKYSIRSLFSRIVRLKCYAAIPIYVLSLLLVNQFYEKEIFYLVAVYCAIHLVNVEVLFFSYFRFTRQGWVVLKARLAVLVPMVVVKIVIALMWGELSLIVMAYLLEAAILRVLAYYLYRKNAPEDSQLAERSADMGQVPGSSRSTRTALSQPSSYQTLASAAWPLFTSALLITLYSRIDQFMIKSMLGESELGLYTAAVKLSEASTIVLATYIASQFPVLMRVSAEDREQYLQQTLKLLRQVFVLSLALVGFVCFFASDIIHLMFGELYAAAALPLTIHICSTLFIYYGIVCTQYLTVAGLEIYRLYRVLLGLVFNIVLNIVFIPPFGIAGAAIATLVSQAFSSIIFNAFSAKTREIFRLQVASLALWQGIR